MYPTRQPNRKNKINERIVTKQKRRLDKEGEKRQLKKTSRMFIADEILKFLVWGIDI